MFLRKRNAGLLKGAFIQIIDHHTNSDLNLSAVFSTPRGQKTVQSLVRSILSSTKPYELPEDPESIQQVLVDLAERIVSLEQQLEEAKRAHVLNGDTMHSSPASASSTVVLSTTKPCPTHSPMVEGENDPIAELIVDFVKQLNLEQQETRSFGGVNSLVTLLGEKGTQAVAIPIEQLQSRRPEFWNVYPYAVRKTDMWTRVGLTESEWNKNVLAELNSMLGTWITAIPEHLKWDPNKTEKTFSVQSTILYVTYYWVQILVHKPFLSPSVKGTMSTFPSLTNQTICANAARSVVHLLEVQPRRVAALFPTVMNAVYSSAIILFINAWRGNLVKNAPNGLRELGDVQKCLRIIQRYEHISQVAGRLSDLIQHLLSICNSVVSNSWSSKRPPASAEDEEERGDSNNPSPEGSRTSFAHPRPVAGSERVSTSASPADVSLLGNRDTALDAIDTQFSLPISSADLGSLPPHENFTSNTSSYPGSAADFDLLAHLGEFSGGAMPHANVGGGGVAMDASSLQESAYTSRTMAESLSTAFGHIGPEVFFAPFGAGSQSGSDPMMHPTHSPGSWTDWDSYMAGLDEVLQMQNAPPTTFQP
ncbi:Gypsy retrotransposon integrase-like protein 1 [Marasmius crinis-equi]|uniref:Gypsy retrotransposon integrase-like protein 1 n=1 Tax=Marasmius crinis-equi TaxID=585013 RepID=A0ABR3FN00_9AGAR